MPEIDSDKVCYVVIKAREFEVDEGAAGNPTYNELKTFINSLNWDEQCQMVALAWTGRGDFSKDEWDDALAEAERAHNEQTAEYLLGMPLLPDYLEEGLSLFDLSCEDFDMGHL